MMFRKTRIRLVTLNVVVVLLLLNGLGSAVYYTMKYRLYSQVDREMTKVSQRLAVDSLPRLHRIEDDPFPFNRQERKKFNDLDRRYVLLVWDSFGRVIGTAFGDRLEPEEYAEFQHNGKADGIETKTVNGQVYRVQTVTVPKKVVVGNRIQTAYQFQLIYNLAPEQNMLDSLLYVVIIGDIISIVIAIVAGWFLARRALIPIQVSWEKQQQFIADASHELRTPLTAIMVNLERLFRHPDHTIEQESEKIMIGMQEAKRLSKLVSDLLTLARSDSNELQIMNQSLRLDEVAMKCTQVFAQLAIAREIRLETDIQQPIEMVGDQERLHQLMVILLDNALKYTNEDGRIYVSCKKEGGRASILVKDSGIGIAKEDIPYLFDRFYRVDKMRSRATEGTGLGLSIAKWIVDAHHGKIQVSSEVGIGTSFLVTLPIKP
ncbi:MULTISPECIES: sensor histidine kinase [Brevibacillus]|uniref:histidine kinase n=1 Tax=Brevibacillus porteri TaxID=2126350 RepID=A0ABX5FP65_9BACL|nr:MULTISPECIES: HAMP domain-containing sensor histidine kinase [Brevibacillus]MDC0765301.1 HAMP domain-containing sensor histidine kinase [Brevibacillus sp. AG]MED1796987.1 HAMP domain-containing sensor histidine kinase [Brevibacillus porteri]MED2744743.1 HAMP domain-containing sensor histidine kinase [Brevibacillus porteri]MED2814536.1 HAMP domain-containing sensor histidine kinase [Brevibacillus porteri]MED4896724.1 HAMP domain-containing sensor histidine kinase [Brevibacillus porteri]